MTKNFLNIEEHQNRYIGSKVTATLQNWGILPNGGVTLGKVCAYSLRSRLVFNGGPLLSDDISYQLSNLSIQNLSVLDPSLAVF